MGKRRFGGNEIEKERFRNHNEIEKERFRNH